MLSTAEHAALGWRISEITADFDLLDVWALPTTGKQEDFPDLATVWNRVTDPETPSRSKSTRVVLSIRERLGEWFGWDDDLNELPIPGCSEISLRERLPDDLEPLSHRDRPGLFLPVFMTDREWVGELSNSTVHIATQLGWVPRSDGMFEGRLAVYVKTRGRFGRLYMRLVEPFRRFIVYPAMVRSIGESWDKRVISAG